MTQKWLKNKTSQGVYQAFWKLIFTSVLTVRMEGVLLTATVASVVPHCERTLLYWAALPCLSVLSCPHEEKIFRGSLIISFVPLWWAPSQTQAPQTWDLVLGSALPSTFQSFLLESHQFLSAAGSHAVSVSFITFLLFWYSCKPRSYNLKWSKKWCRAFIFSQW